jgi:hypothetical protein
MVRTSGQLRASRADQDISAPLQTGTAPTYRHCRPYSRQLNSDRLLDAEARTAIAHGAPRVLRDGCDHPAVHAFMARERPEQTALAENINGRR